jgi:hypothetical protein
MAQHTSLVGFFALALFAQLVCLLLLSVCTAGCHPPARSHPWGVRCMVAWIHDDPEPHREVDPQYDHLLVTLLRRVRQWRHAAMTWCSCHWRGRTSWLQGGGLTLVACVLHQAGHTMHITRCTMAPVGRDQLLPIC